MGLRDWITRPATKPLEDRIIQLEEQIKARSTAHSSTSELLVARDIFVRKEVGQVGGVQFTLSLNQPLYRELIEQTPTRLFELRLEGFTYVVGMGKVIYIGSMGTVVRNIPISKLNSQTPIRYKITWEAGKLSSEINDLTLITTAGVPPKMLATLGSVGDSLKPIFGATIGGITWL